MQHAFEELLQKPLANADSVKQPPVFVIMDGLDECRDRDLVPDLLRLMLELVRSAPWLRVFAASRPEPHVLAMLTSTEAQAMIHTRNLDDTLQEWNDDVRRYLESEVPKIPTYGAFLREHPAVLESLIRRAGGVFIYARIAVRFLDSYHDHPEEQFELLLASGGAGLSPLDALYLQVLHSAFPPKDLRASKPRQKRLHLVLNYITLGRRNLAPGSIALFEPGLSENDIVAVVDRLRSVLLINYDGRVVPLHATFGEFLLDDGRCNDLLYHVDRPKGHAHLASACLDVSTSFQTLTYCIKAGKKSTLGEYADYAKGYWELHLAEAEFNDGLAQQVFNLVEATPTYTGFYTSNFSHPDAAARMTRFLTVSIILTAL